jgi:hypothetical protein
MEGESAAGRILIGIAVVFLAALPVSASEGDDDAQGTFLDAARTLCLVRARSGSIDDLAEGFHYEKVEASLVPLAGPRRAFSIPVKGPGRVYVSVRIDPDGAERDCAITGYGVDAAAAASVLRAWWGKAVKSVEVDGRRVETFAPFKGPEHREQEWRADRITLETWLNIGEDKPSIQETYHTPDTEPYR